MLVRTVVLPQPMLGQDSETALNKIYKDESHCLVAPEIRSEKDNPISCYCRDAIVDARYVHYTYVDSGKDRNLSGVVLTLVGNIEQMCGETGKNLNGWEPLLARNWKWDGPEVVRSYPPDSEIDRIAPDSAWFRNVRYKLRLIFHDQQGQLSRVENFSALDRLPTQTTIQEQAVPKKFSTPTIEPGVKSEPQGPSYAKAAKKFGFSVKSVEQEAPPSTMYRVEGLSADNVWFLLSCHSVPPSSYWKGLAREQLVERFDQYDGIEKFRKNATEKVDLASEVREGVMLLYAMQGQNGQDSNSLANEVFDQCAVLNRIPNGDSIFPITVSSSEFRNWKDGAGYEVEAQTKDESLTLACAEGKGQACHSLPPKAYRAIRRQSQGEIWCSSTMQT